MDNLQLDNEIKGNSSERITFMLSPGKRLAIFIFLALIGFLISGALNELVLKFMGVSTRSMRIAAVLQSVFQMILPALALSMMVTRWPAQFLGVSRRFSNKCLCLAVCALLFSIPAMNLIISLNNSIHFPESMSALEQTMRHLEDAANQSVEMLMGGDGIGDLIVSILIVGVFAGLGEELLFRGAFLNTLLSMRLDKHLAVWIVAFIFSALHFQFYGFVPRMLLGAFFGYAYIWSGSLWLSVCLHALNNILFVVSRWCALRGITEADNIDNMFSGETWIWAIASVLLTAIVIYRFYLCRTKKPLLSK